MGAKSHCLIGLSCFLQVAVATAIIVITALKLHKINVGFNSSTFNADVSNVCLLGNTEQGGNLCYFAYIVSGISIIATGILSILQCCTCNLCGLGTILDAIFAAAGTVIWAVAGVIFNYYEKLPQMTGVPQYQWRRTIPILSFTACALFGLMCLAAIYSVLSACCCGGPKRGYKSRQGRNNITHNKSYADVEAPGNHAQVAIASPVYLPATAGPAAKQGQFVVAGSSAGGYWATGASRF